MSRPIAKPALIPVIYQDAKDVAEVVKSIFGDRIAGAQSGGGRGGGGGGGGGQPSPQDFINALRGGGGGRGGRGGDAPTSEPSKISVAVDAKSNSLVVIATPQDFNEVRQLVEALDQSSMVKEETIVTYATNGSVNPDVLKAALESILGTQAKSTKDGSSSTSSTTGTPGSSGGTPDSSAEIQRRIEAFRALRGGAPGGFGGRGGAPGGFGTRGGAPGGFGGRGGRWCSGRRRRRWATWRSLTRWHTNERTEATANQGDRRGFDRRGG